MKKEKSQTFYKLLCDQAADGIFTIDLKGKILYANKTACRMIKLLPAEIIGKHFLRFVAGDSLRKAGEYFDKVRAGNPVIRDQLEIIDKNGFAISVEFSATAIYQHGKVFQFHVIIRDISERKRLECLALETEKIKALEHFVVGMTREIQIPLKALLAQSQNLIRLYEGRHFEYISFKEFQEMMKTIKLMNSQIKNSFQTTSRLLAIYKKNLGFKDGCCQVNRVVQDVIQPLKTLMKRTETRLNVNFTPQLPFAAMGSVELNQVIHQVLINAMQSIPGKGSISVRTKLCKDKKCICIECQDDGIGIPKENLPHIFDPFFTTKKFGPENNTGLGLSIVYSMIKAHQGDIIIASDLRKGTTVKIFLPVHR